MSDLAKSLGIDPHVSKPVEPLPPPEPPETNLEGFCRRRHLDAEHLTQRFLVSEAEWHGRPALRFPTTVGVDRIKYLDGAKPKATWVGKNGGPHWYGLQTAKELLTDDGVLYLVNGEPSVWACSQSGIPAVCLCIGEGSTSAIPDLTPELIEVGVQMVRVVYDLDETGRKGARAAVEALRAGGLGALALDLPSDLGPGGDVDDLHRRTGDGDLALALRGLSELPPEQNDDPSIDPLAPLGDLEQDPDHKSLNEALTGFAAVVAEIPSELTRKLHRKKAIEQLEKLGMKTGATSLVDAALNDAKEDQEPDDEGGLGLVDPIPWPDPVDGAELLDELTSTFRRFLVLPDHAAEAMALWTVHAHAHEASMISPLLCIRSPEKGSGKTTTLDVVKALVPRPLLTANATPAVVFRTIEACRPTLLIDEADTFIKDNLDLRGIINAGHRRGEVVLRVVGDHHEPKAFSVWSPKAIALIGDLPDTLEDRSVIVSLYRASAKEFSNIDGFRLDRHPEELNELCRRSARWVDDSMDLLTSSDPQMPSSLYGRSADNWRPLIAIADAAGGSWPQWARDAAVTLDGRSESESRGVQLLEDLKSIFDREDPNGDHVVKAFSAGLVQELIGMEGRPWPEYWRGKPLSAQQMARLLRKYEIKPKTIRIGEGRSKGYERGQFEDVWRRYL